MTPKTKDTKTDTRITRVEVIGESGSEAVVTYMDDPEAFVRQAEPGWRVDLRVGGLGDPESRMARRDGFTSREEAEDYARQVVVEADVLWDRMMAARVKLMKFVDSVIGAVNKDA